MGECWNSYFYYFDGWSVGGCSATSPRTRWRMLTSAPGWWTGTLAHWTSRSGSTTGTTAIQFASGLFFVDIAIVRHCYCRRSSLWFEYFFLLFFFSSYFLFPSVWFDLSVAGIGTFFLGRISGQSQILYPGPDVENNNLDPDPKETMRIQAEGESGRVTILWTGWIRIVSNESGSVIFVLFCRYLGTDPN